MRRHHYFLIGLLFIFFNSGFGEEALPLTSKTTGYSRAKENALRSIFTRLVSRHPDWPWSWWVQKQFGNPGGYGYLESTNNELWEFWGMIGVPNTADESLIGRCGELQPRDSSYAITIMVYDHYRDTLHCPQKDMTRVSQNLLYGYLPIVITHFTPVGLNITLTEFSHAIADIELNFGSFVVSNTDSVVKEVSLFLVITPVAPQGFNTPIYSIAYDSEYNLVLVNNDVAIVCDTTPTNHAFYGNPDNEFSLEPYEENDPYIDALDGNVINNDSTYDHVYGYCRAALQFDFSLAPGDSSQVTFKTPVSEVTSIDDLPAIDYSTAYDEVKNFWKGYLNQGIQVEIPGEPRVAHAFKASLAYLYILMDNDEAHPGPTDYDYWWYRDGAIEATALAVAGQFDLAKDFLITAFPSRYNPATGRFEFWNEWDSNGQAIWAFVNYYKLNRDTAYLQAMWPYIRGGAQWIENTRATEPDGLLPPGWSAEHLGPGDKKHYWDDFWGLAGLKSAAFAANEIGYSDEQTTLQGYYDNFWQDLFNSINQTQQNHGIDYIANGPNLWELNSFLIGSIAGVWPCGVLSPTNKDQLATLEALWDNCFVDGGFLHRMAWNAYGSYLSTEVAHCYLFAGKRHRVRKILNWQLDHATPLYAWNEQVVPEPELGINSWYLGDIPHGWACAEYVLLVRDMLFYEDFDSNRIVICPGVQEEWIPEGELLSVGNAPTYFGTIFSFDLQNNISQGNVKLSISPSKDPQRGYVFKSPFTNYQIARVNVDGVEIETFSQKEAFLPPGSRNVTIYFESTGILECYPNPFDSQTTIYYQLPVAGEVKIIIYNLLGERIRVLFDGYKVPGCYTICWDGKDDYGKSVCSGIYFCRLNAGTYSSTGKLILIK